MCSVVLKKMERYLLFCAVLIIIYGFGSSHTITYKRPCRNLSPECLKKSIQSAIPFFANGSPELGLVPLDPYTVDRLDINLSGISIRFSEGIATGFKTCIVDFARIIEESLEMQTHCNITIQGRYRSSGKLLMFPIDGDGKSNIKCENLKIHSKLKLGTKIKNDEKYLEITNTVIKHAYDGRVSYFMTNLFKDNNEISKAVLDFMNSNWRIVAEEFGKPLVEIGIKAFMTSVRRFLDVMPINELQRL